MRLALHKPPRSGDLGVRAFSNRKMIMKSEGRLGVQRHSFLRRLEHSMPTNGRPTPGTTPPLVFFFFPSLGRFWFLLPTTDAAALPTNGRQAIGPPCSPPADSPWRETGEARSEAVALLSFPTAPRFTATAAVSEIRSLPFSAARLWRGPAFSHTRYRSCGPLADPARRS